VRGDVVLENAEKIRHDRVSAERRGQPPVDIHRRFRLLERAGQRNADVRVLRFPGAVHDAAHHGHLHVFDARVTVAPHRHLLAKIVLNVLGHVLEERRRRSSTSGTCGHLRREIA